MGSSPIISSRFLGTGRSGSLGLQPKVSYFREAGVTQW